MESESFEDQLLLPLPEDPSSPIPQRQLKRLKKSAPASESRVSDTSIVANASDSGGLPDFPKISGDLEGSASFDDGLDPLFSVPKVGGGLETLDPEEEPEEVGEWLGKEKSARKRLILDGESEENPKKKKKIKSQKLSRSDRKPKESVREKRRLEKERKVHLEQIHAESQRLLRETRDVSFKPVPLVQKPISSVLEKIRLRKLEVLKRSNVPYESDSVDGTDFSRGKIDGDSNSTSTQGNAINNKQDVEVEDSTQVLGVESRKRLLDLTEFRKNALDVDSKDSYRMPITDTQDAAKESKLTDKDNQLNDSKDIPDPPLPTSSFRSDDDDCSLSEDENDKENIDPHPSIAINMDSPPKGGLAKAFLDDEAEEEDDSDHDLMRFEENDEDDESDEVEVLNDIIATGYEEAPVDHERRNQLHQKWLEQQDAAGTDNILQRLKSGHRQREPSCSPEKSDDEDFGEESEDEEASHDLPLRNVVRQNSMKAKQMAAQMFTDGDDAYVDSDDEESEQTLIRQRILKQSIQGEPSFIAPVEDDHSREVFGLIKKLNIAPATKKKGKMATSGFDTLTMGGNNNSSSKSSFLNRAAGNSLSSSHKQGSTTVRAYIFGRDDSNSRSCISASESTSDMGPTENQPTRTATSTKPSQSKSTASKTKADANSGSSSVSLFQILRQSSMHFDEQMKNKTESSSHVSTESQAAYKFSAFRLGKRVSKVE